MKHLLLDGFMATGKTTTGYILGTVLQMPFVDLDEEIQRVSGLTVADIFAQRGEDAFRALETQALEAALAGPPAVIAGGAGLLGDRINQRIADASALVIVLDCSVEESVLRITGDGEHLRPVGSARLMSEGVDGLRRLKEERASAYVVYPHVSTDNVSPTAVAHEVVEIYQQLQGAVGAVYELRFPGHAPSRILFSDTVIGPHQWVLTDMTVDAILPVVEGQHRIVIEPGESAKTLQTAEHVYRRLQAAQANRQTPLTAAGGGVICDLGGFVASTYLRGLPLSLVPTTLLAQVDAAIGGKTGVDLDGFKNAVGTFYPASTIQIDPFFLDSLPIPLLQDGLAEIVKIAMAWDAGLFEELETLNDARDILTRDELVRQAIRDKVEVVSRDPLETTGIRALLNFGHTVGHAVETVSGYSISHGRCVAMGMVPEARIAERRGLLAGDVVSRLTDLLNRLGLPAEAPALDRDALLAAMRQDKKRAAGSMRMVLPSAPGTTTLLEVDEGEVRAVLPLENRP
jgi:shikimate kinase/3-dehydroquinate synthase